MMKNMNFINDQIKVISHQLNILKWEAEFSNNLKEKVQKDLELFPVDKLWFEEYKKSITSDIPVNQRIENYYSFYPVNNSNILHDMKSINPNSDFVFLNQEVMEGFSPSVMKNKIFNIKIIGRFYNGKMISRIGKNLYYCCFLDNNVLNEGFLMFGNIEITSINPIITEFLNQNINLFINRYFTNGPSSNQKFIVYHRNDFDFLIKKGENNTINAKHNLKVINIPKNNGNMKIDNLKPGNIKRNYKITSPYKKSFNNKINYKKSNIKEKNEENGLNYSIPIKINNLANCILEYFYSEKTINNFINDKSSFKTFKMINNIWLQKFKKKYMYDEIKQILLSNKNSINYEKIISEFLYNNNLNNINFEYIPLGQQENSIRFNKRNSYYNDYYLITKKSFSEFCKTFNIQENDKEYNSYLLDDNNIFVQYNDESGEIICFNDANIEHKYFIFSDSYLNKIINNLQKFGVQHGLSYYNCNVYDPYKEEFELIDKSGYKPKKIGKLKILNNSKIFKSKNLSDGDEFMDDGEKFIENGGNMKKIKKYDDEYKQYNPKIIKKRRVLRKNMKNMEKVKEDEFSNTFTNFNKSPKTNIKMKEYLNDEDDDEPKYFKTPNNQIKTRKYFKSQKKEMQHKDEPEKNYKQSIKMSTEKFGINSSNSKLKENNNFHRSNKKIDLNQFKQSFGSEINKNYKIKSQIKNSQNEMKTPPQKFNKNYKFTHSKNSTKINKSFLSPQRSDNYKIKKFGNKYGFNADNNFNKTFQSQQLTTNKFKNNIQDLPDEDFSDLEETQGLTGLQNIGATCYMNATLQCFSNVPRFREGILNLKNKSNDPDLVLSYSLHEVFKNLWKNNKIKYYAPYNFKDLISEMNPLFKGIAANDSKDLILFILETIHNELNKKKDLPPVQNQINNLNFISVFNGFVNEYTSTNESIVSDEFYGYFVSIMKCEYCKATTYNVQIMNILFFPLEKVRLFTKTGFNFVTIEDCFRHYEEPELFTGQNQIYCTQCKLTTNAYNQNKLIIGPKTLIINLNRGKGLQFKVGIKFGEFLDLTEYLLMKDKSPCHYELIGVLSHFGENNMGGHFIAYCKNSYNCKWYKYNDAMVTESSFQEASSIGLPYVLFYSYVSS